MEFKKSKQEQFKLEIRLPCSSLPDSTTGSIDHSYELFVKEIKKIASHSISRGHRKEYIHVWDTHCNQVNYINKSRDQSYRS